MGGAFFRLSVLNLPLNIKNLSFIATDFSEKTLANTIVLSIFVISKQYQARLWKAKNLPTKA
jgi:hypothetical protein